LRWLRLTGLAHMMLMVHRLRTERATARLYNLKEIDLSYFEAD
jgi:hypothetical protein